ncbi:hypothetical protein ESCO_000348 [Escovopsis weberi]|uniref:CENP-V/GFA domain-containing protein n=1 Tax=Escovopsis weberi TaxID=150374 RepID=A0A0M8N4F2_ESCWE|nr:hypothetical protein ESCO_000348 [Escovopsis weberi]
MADTDTKTLELKCYCGSVHMTFDVPRADFPLFSYTCQCSSCRFTTGAPCIFHTQLTPGIQPKFVAPSSQSNLKTYLPEGNRYSYESCTTCGCHVTCLSIDRTQWIPSISILSETGPGVFQIKIRGFSRSVKDLGIAPYLARMGGRDIPEYNMPPGHPQSRLVEASPEVGEDGTDRLRVQCHCAGVSFTVKRPPREVLDDMFLSAWVCPEDQSRWLAAFDLCDDCRLQTGTHVNGWMFVPPSSCEPAVPPDLKMGTIKTYASSPGVLRGFCGDCGATVFLARADRRLSDERAIISISTGLIRAPEGFMARDWLGWRSKVAFLNDGKRFDREFAESLEEGFKAYNPLN